MTELDLTGSPFNFGEAAARSGVSAKMIRHYETLSLLPKVGRTASGHRQYGPREVHTEMAAMKRTLESLAACCHGDDRPDCPILDELAE